MSWSGLDLLNCNTVANKSTILNRTTPIVYLTALDDHAACSDWSPIPSASAGTPPLEQTRRQRDVTWQLLLACAREDVLVWRVRLEFVLHWSTLHVCGSSQRTATAYPVTASNVDDWSTVLALYCLKIINNPPTFDVHSLLVVKLHLGIHHTLISEQKFCWSFTLNISRHLQRVPWSANIWGKVRIILHCIVSKATFFSRNLLLFSQTCGPAATYAVACARVPSACCFSLETASYFSTRPNNKRI